MLKYSIDNDLYFWDNFIEGKKGIQKWQTKNVTNQF